MGTGEPGFPSSSGAGAAPQHSPHFVGRVLRRTREVDDLIRSLSAACPRKWEARGKSTRKHNITPHTCIFCSWYLLCAAQMNGIGLLFPGFLVLCWTVARATVKIGDVLNYGTVPYGFCFT